MSLSELSGIIGTGAQTITATFSEAVTGFTAADVSLTNASLSNFTTVSTSSYTFDIMPSASGTVSVQVPAASLTDLAGNDNTASSTLSATADLTPPTTRFPAYPAVSVRGRTP